MRRSLGFSLVELIVAVATVSVLAALLLPTLARGREASRRSSCANNLRQFGFAIQMYTQESCGGLTPPQQFVSPMSDESCMKPAFDFALSGASVFPEYVSDDRIWLCPSDPVDTTDRFHEGQDPTRPVNPCRLNAASYLYLGWLVPSDVVHGARDPNDLRIPTSAVEAARQGFLSEEAGYSMMAMALMINEGLPKSIGGVQAAFEMVDSDFFTGAYVGGGSRTLPRLRDGVERFVITDINDPAAGSLAASEIPIMFDRISTIAVDFNHVPSGANILYLDGHAEFVKYPALEFPMTRASAVFIAAPEEVLN